MLRLVNNIVKKLLNFLMKAFSFLFFITYCWESWIIGKRKAMAMMSETIGIIPGVCGEWLRRGFIQWVTDLPLNDCCLSFGVLFSDPRLKIYDGVYIGRRSDIGYVEIGCNCVIGSGVHILSGMHQHGIADMDIPICDQPGVYSKVVIGSGCWIGNGAIIGSTIGYNCVIGSGSVVVKPLPDNVIAAGNPAKIISYRNKEQG